MAHATLVLPMNLTIYEVEQQAALWLALVQAQPDEVAFDVQTLEELDGAGFQLLISLCKAMAHSKLRLASPVTSLQQEWLCAQLQQHGFLTREDIC